MLRTTSRNRNTLVAVAVALCTVAGGSVYAQEQQRPDDQARHDQYRNSDQNHDDTRARGEGQARHEDRGRHEDEGRHQDQRRHEDQDRHDEHSGDIERYRREHPRAAARCHDGFFTNTMDRGRACSRHGGIEIWLRE